MEEQQDSANDAGEAEDQTRQRVDQLQQHQAPPETTPNEVGRELERPHHDRQQIHPHLPSPA
ncbi:MAG: hypothetical protein M3077_13195 [Candidatus Dormibacteraeota bacterium]|nr:hypothetical protein [Candidatus Dormibacteraeota bacterium]